MLITNKEFIKPTGSTLAYPQVLEKTPNVIEYDEFNKDDRVSTDGRSLSEFLCKYNFTLSQI